MSSNEVYAAFESTVKRWGGLRILSQRDFGGEPRSVAKARHWVTAVLSAHVSAEVLETVELLVSEVVTNAVVHSDSGTDPDGLVTVGVGMCADLVYIEVIDQGSAFNVPAMRSADEDSLSGRGLSWVNHLSARWGSDHASEIGRTVWFEVQI